MRFALLGDPVAHSLSPAMHAAAFRALGLPHTYEAIRTAAPELGARVAELRAGAFAGLNVTIPHKRRVLDLSDDVDRLAKAADAANTLAVRSQRIFAANTDVPAIAARLRALGAATDRAIVIGSGGAARAAKVALAEMGVREVAVRARKGSFAPDRAWESKTTIVIQATSAGMIGKDPGEEVARVVDWAALPKEAVALDVVYAPDVTPFLTAARDRGLRAESGLAMLVEQGALALELWLGVRAPREAMLRVVVR